MVAAPSLMRTIDVDGAFDGVRCARNRCDQSIESEGFEARAAAQDVGNKTADERVARVAADQDVIARFVAQEVEPVAPEERIVARLLEEVVMVGLTVHRVISVAAEAKELLTVARPCNRLLSLSTKHESWCRWDLIDGADGENLLRTGVLYRHPRRAEDWRRRVIVRNGAGRTQRRTIDCKDGTIGVEGASNTVSSSSGLLSATVRSMV